MKKLISAVTAVCLLAGIFAVQPFSTKTKAKEADPFSVRFKSVAAGRIHSLALDTDGNVWGWGMNSIELDFKNPNDIEEPRNGGGGGFRLGIVDDTMCVPEPQMIIEGNFIFIDAGGTISMAIDQPAVGNRRAYTWGWLNETGRNVYWDESQAPTQIRVGHLSVNTDIVYVSGTLMSYTFLSRTGHEVQRSYLIDSDGFLYGWGYCSQKRLGVDLGSTINQWTPYTVTNDIMFKAVASGYDHGVGLSKDGMVYAWGFDPGANGQDRVSVAPPEPVNTGGNECIAVAAGDMSSFALDSEGNILAWGRGESGYSYAIPSKILDGAGVKFTSFSVKAHHGLAVDAGGNVWGWGMNGSGQVGDGTKDDVPFAGGVKVIDVEEYVAEGKFVRGEYITEVSAGASHSLAVTSKGRLFAWGDWTYGEDEDDPVNSLVPIQIGGPLDPEPDPEVTAPPTGAPLPTGTAAPTGSPEPTPEPSSEPGTQTKKPDETEAPTSPSPGTPGPSALPTVSPTPEAPEMIYGDVNGDGELDGEDLICLKRFILDWDDYLPGAANYKGPGCLDPDGYNPAKPYADVDGDGEAATGDDLICLKRHILDWDYYIPPTDSPYYKGPGAYANGRVPEPIFDPNFGSGAFYPKGGALIIIGPPAVPTPTPMPYLPKPKY